MVGDSMPQSLKLTPNRHPYPYLSVSPLQTPYLSASPLQTPYPYISVSPPTDPLPLSPSLNTTPPNHNSQSHPYKPLPLFLIFSPVDPLPLSPSLTPYRPPTTTSHLHPLQTPLPHILASPPTDLLLLSPSPTPYKPPYSCISASPSSFQSFPSQPNLGRLRWEAGQYFIKYNTTNLE